MIRLGVIIAQPFLSQMQNMKYRLEQNGTCELRLHTYGKLSELLELYPKVGALSDGIVLTELAYMYLEGKWGGFTIPTFCYEISETDLYKCLFQISLSQPDLQFSRVLIDFVWEENDYLGLRHVVSDTDFPITVPYMQLEKEISHQHVYKEIAARHLNLWHEGKIDFSITRFGNIVPILRENGVPHIYLVPSEKSISQQIKQIITEIEMIQLADNQIVIGHLSFTSPSPEDTPQEQRELQLMLLHKSVLEFTIEAKIPLVIQKTGNGLECISSLKDLQMITDYFTNCRLMSFLEDNLPFRVNLGWGTGDTMYRARKNAMIASEQSAESLIQGTFVLQANGQVIGPLGSGSHLSYSSELAPYIEDISRSTGISPLQLQKIWGVLAKTDTNELTSEDMAYHLGITVRSANRILSKLVEKGVASLSNKKQEKLRGRPKKIYSIHLSAVTSEVPST